MMMHYEKPDILRVDNLSEGVYLASGGVAVCKSQFLKGNWTKPHRGIYQGPRVEVWGCEGCPGGDDGDYCKLAKGEVHDDKDYRPTWEREGLDPYEITW